jgi:hypothetical protein
MHCNVNSHKLLRNFIILRKQKDGPLINEWTVLGFTG